MKFYHKFANGWKAINTIWQLMNENGNSINTFPHLSSLATSHFKQIYRAPPMPPLLKSFEWHNYFPILWIRRMHRNWLRKSLYGELEATIKWFKRDKSLGLDGWSVEFYLAFFETLSADLLKVLRIPGSMARCMKLSILHSFPSYPNLII
jgi:hypothetical protein